MRKDPARFSGNVGDRVVSKAGVYSTDHVVSGVVHSVRIDGRVVEVRIESVEPPSDEPWFRKGTIVRSAWFLWRHE